MIIGASSAHCSLEFVASPWPAAEGRSGLSGHATSARHYLYPNPKYRYGLYRLPWARHWAKTLPIVALACRWSMLKPTATAATPLVLLHHTPAVLDDRRAFGKNSFRASSATAAANGYRHSPTSCECRQRASRDEPWSPAVY